MSDETPRTLRIYDRCPACGYDTLTIHDHHLLCTWIGGRTEKGCPNPGAARQALEAALLAPSLPPTVEEARDALTYARALCRGRLDVEAPYNREIIRGYVGTLDLLLAQRHASAQEIARLTNQRDAEEVRAEQAEAQLAGWQPIATAPVVEGFMGEPINALVYGPHLGVHRGRVARYADGLLYAGVSHINGNSADAITHWQPLPLPPTETK